MRKPILIFCLFFVVSLFAGQKQDLQFILGLCSDQNYSLAKTELLKFLQKNPRGQHSSKASYLLAEVHFNLQEYEQALQKYQEVEKLLPEFDDKVCLGKAKCYYYLQDFPKAKALLSGYSYQSKKEQVYYYLSLIAYQRADFIQSVVQSKNSLRVKATGYARAQLILSYLALKSPEKACDEVKKSLQDREYGKNLLNYLSYLLGVESYKDVITMSVSLANLDSKAQRDYNTVLGIAHYNLGNYQRAIEILQVLENPRARFYFGVSLLAEGKNEEAKKIFTELQNSASFEIAANSSFYLAKMKSEASPMNAIYDLKEFVQDHPSHRFSGSAFYLIGWNYFNLEKYKKAEFYLKKSLEHTLNPQLLFDALFLYAESLFAQDILSSAISAYQSYLDKDKKFADQVYYKLGVIYYRLEKFAKSKENFNKVLSEFPKSLKVASSYFYLGEIDFSQKMFEQANDNFLKFLQYEKSESAYSRLAAVNYKLGNLKKAADYLSKVKKVNLYEKHLLQGDIFFDQQKLNLALENYQEALKSKNANQTEVNLRIACVYYNGQEYDKALQIYQELYEKQKMPDYLLDIANIYFAKEDYQSAVKYFVLYEDKSKKQTPDLHFSIANCYYNSGDYLQSIIYYKKLILPKSKLLQEGLEGLVWAGACDTTIDVARELSALFAKYKDKSFRLQLLLKEIEYHQNSNSPEEAVKACQAFLSIAPQDLQVNLLLAKNYIALGEYQKADNVYSVCKTDDPQVVLNWAKLKFDQKDTLGALSKLQSGALKGQNQEIWLEYLKFLSLTKSPIFESKFVQYSTFADQIYLQQANIYKVEYLLKIKEFDKANEIITHLFSSKHEQIVSTAGYLLGLFFYEQEEYQKAVVEFLKTAYLFPDRQDLALQANIKAIYCYYYLKQPGKAKIIFDKIKNSLTENLLKKITFMLGLTYEKDNI